MKFAASPNQCNPIASKKSWFLLSQNAPTMSVGKTHLSSGAESIFEKLGKLPISQNAQREVHSTTANLRLFWQCP
jgi:hypothetical protein